MTGQASMLLRWVGRAEARVTHPGQRRARPGTCDSVIGAITPAGVRRDKRRSPNANGARTAGLSPGDDPSGEVDQPVEDAGAELQRIDGYAFVDAVEQR